MERKRAQAVLSRRDLLRAGALGAVAAFLAACGAEASATLPGRTAGAIGSVSGASGATSSGGSSAPSSGASSGASAAPSSVGTATATPIPSAVIGLSLREKIGRVLVVGMRGTTVSKSSPVAKAIAAGELGGVILFDRNITSPTQLANLTAALSGFAPEDAPLLISVDQEGGFVQRLGPAHGFPNVPSEETVGGRDSAYASSVYGSMATTLSNAGINLNLAPVVDVNVNPRSAAIGAIDRSFSANPAVVTTMARASIRAHHAHGVLTTLKHFPGIGSAAGNTDTGVVDVTKTWSDRELGPFRDLSTSGDADVVMVGHVINTKLDKKYPASLSHAMVTNLLRHDVGWDGPVITDDMQAAAITKRFKQADAIALALNAGVDLLLFAAPSSSTTFYSSLVSSIEALVKAGKIRESRLDEAVARVAVLREQL